MSANHLVNRAIDEFLDRLIPVRRTEDQGCRICYRAHGNESGIPVRLTQRSEPDMEIQ